MYLADITKTHVMNTIEKIQNEIAQLKEARKMNLISVNEYCTFYYQLSQKLKKAS